MSKGWYGQSPEHSLAARGIKIKANALQSVLLGDSRRDKSALGTVEDKARAKEIESASDKEIQQIIKRIVDQEESVEKEQKSIDRENKAKLQRLQDLDVKKAIYGGFGFGDVSLPVVKDGQEKAFWKVIPSTKGELRLISRTMMDSVTNQPVIITVNINYTGSVRTIPDTIDINMNMYTTLRSGDSFDPMYKPSPIWHKQVSYSTNLDNEFLPDGGSINRVGNHTERFGTPIEREFNVSGNKTKVSTNESEFFYFLNNLDSKLFEKAAPLLAARGDMLVFNRALAKEVKQSGDELAGQFPVMETENFLSKSEIKTKIALNSRTQRSSRGLTGGDQ